MIQVSGLIGAFLEIRGSCWAVLISEIGVSIQLFMQLERT